MSDLEDTTFDVLDELQTDKLLDIQPDGKFAGRIAILADRLMRALFEEVKESDGYGFKVLSRAEYPLGGEYQKVSYADLINIMISNFKVTQSDDFFSDTFRVYRQRDNQEYSVTYGAALRSGYFHMLKETVRQDRTQLQMKDWQRFLVMVICTPNWTMPVYFTKIYKNQKLAPSYLSQTLSEYERRETKKKIPSYAKWLVKKFPNIQQPVFRLFKQYCLKYGLDKLASLLAEAYSRELGETNIEKGIEKYKGMFQDFSYLEKGQKKKFFDVNFTTKMIHEDFTSTIKYYEEGDSGATIALGQTVSRKPITIGGQGSTKKLSLSMPTNLGASQKKKSSTVKMSSTKKSSKTSDFQAKLKDLADADSKFVDAIQTLVTKLSL